MMWGLSGKLKKKYNVEGDVRDNLYKVCPLVGFAAWPCKASGWEPTCDVICTLANVRSLRGMPGGVVGSRLACMHWLAMAHA